MPAEYPHPSADSDGVPAAAADDVIVSRWNDFSLTEELIRRHAPDLATFGKALTNGMPMTGIAGSREIIGVSHPHRSPSEARAYFGNTLNGNPLCAAAGVATLDVLGRPGVYERLESSTGKLKRGVAQIAARLGVGCRSSATARSSSSPSPTTRSATWPTCGGPTPTGSAGSCSAARRTECSAPASSTSPSPTATPTSPRRST